MRNIALGRGSTTRPSTSMAPSFLAILFWRSLAFRFVSTFRIDYTHSAQPSIRLENVSRIYEVPVFPGQGTRKVGTETAPLVNTTRSEALPKIAERPAQRSGILVS